MNFWNKCVDRVVITGLKWFLVVLLIFLTGWLVYGVVYVFPHHYEYIDKCDAKCTPAPWVVLSDDTCGCWHIEEDK